MRLLFPWQDGVQSTSSGASTIHMNGLTNVRKTERMAYHEYVRSLSHSVTKQGRRVHAGFSYHLSAKDRGAYANMTGGCVAIGEAYMVDTAGNPDFSDSSPAGLLLAILRL